MYLDLKHIIYSKDEAVAVVQFDRPESFNACLLYTSRYEERRDRVRSNLTLAR